MERLAADDNHTLPPMLSRVAIHSPAHFLDEVAILADTLLLVTADFS
jgi:hypothetical protein